MYTYACQVERVIDADTLVLIVDLGFGITRKDTFRLLGIDCPELRTEEGKAARLFTVAWIAERGNQLTVRTMKDKQEKFGRYLADLYSGVSDLVADLKTAGYVK